MDLKDFEKELSMLGGSMEKFYNEPQTNYTKEQFAGDLKQLGGMIESLYTMEGGGKPETNATELNEKHKMRDSDGKTWIVKKIRGKKRWSRFRTFKVVSIDGKKGNYKYGPYNSAEPRNAAKKAGFWICKDRKLGKDCTLTLMIQETTQGSKKEIYPKNGIYSWKWVKRDKPRMPGFKGAKKQTHDRHVTLQKK